MSTLRLSPYSDSFGRTLGWSLALHCGLFLFLVAKATFFPSEEIIIRHAIRVDVVGLPDKVLTPAPPAPSTPTEKVALPKSEAKPEPTAKELPKLDPAKPDLKAAKKSQTRALEKLKALQSIEKMKSDLAEKAAREKAKENAFRGNILAHGTGLQGLDKVEFDRYFAAIEQQVRQNWNLPSWLAEKPLKAQALVRIDVQGMVTKKEIYRSSGNEVFDSYVLAAIDRAGAFPPPPDRLRDVLAFRGIVFNFPE